MTCEAFELKAGLVLPHWAWEEAMRGEVRGSPAIAQSIDSDYIMLFLQRGPNLAYRAVVSKDEEGGQWVAHNRPNSEPQYQSLSTAGDSGAR